MNIKIIPMRGGDFNWTVTTLDGIQVATGTGTTFVDVGQQALASIKNYFSINQTTNWT
jgi:hypothetical protein